MYYKAKKVSSYTKEDEQSISNLLSTYFTSERVNWQDECYNKHCRKIFDHKKTNKITILPKILIINVIRYNSTNKSRNSTIIKFTNVIDLSEYLEKSCNSHLISTKYELFAITNHVGNENGGHYYSTIKIKENWYEFDDSEVRKTEIKYKSDEIYTLYYERSY